MATLLGGGRAAGSAWHAGTGDAHDVDDAIPAGGFYKREAQLCLDQMSRYRRKRCPAAGGGRSIMPATPVAFLP